MNLFFLCDGWGVIDLFFFLLMLRAMYICDDGLVEESFLSLSLPPFFPSLNLCSTNTSTIIISKSFRYLRFWWSKGKKRNWASMTESDNEAWVYREHNGANHELFGIFFSFQPLSIDSVVIDYSRRWWNIIIIITIKKSDQIMYLNLMLLCS